MANTYTFTLNNFHIQSAMAGGPFGGGNDTDWVYFTVKIGNQTYGPIHARIGDTGKGATRELDWAIGPVLIGDGVPVLLSYQIFNMGHGDEASQIAKDVQIAGTISSAIGSVVGIVFPPAGIISAVVGAALNALSKIIPDFAPDCDGMVLSDSFSANGGTLFNMTQWTAQNPFHQTQQYIGPTTPDFCGSDAIYDVTWSFARNVVPSINLAQPLVDVVIINRNSGLCLDVPSSAQNDGIRIQQYFINNGRNQQWRLARVQNGSGYTITSVNTIGAGLVPKCLDIPGGSKDSGTLVQQFTTNNGKNQQWVLTPTSDGYYYIFNANSNLYLDVPNGSIDPCILVQQYPFNGGHNQQWTLAATTVIR
jgi:hypothetical protein